MKTKPLLILAFAAASITAAAASAASSPKEALAAFHAALVAGDKARVLELMAPDVAIYESGRVERSRDEYASHHLGGDMEFAQTATRKVLKQSERADGNMAVIWQETETSGTSRGKPIHVLGTETALLEQNGSTWRIVHVHWSSRKK
jgi:ketosteroid isomerase-like protein